MKKWIWTLLVCSGCGMGNSALSMNAFYDIPVGAQKNEVIARAGDPYSIRKKEGGVEEFEYIERMQAGSRMIQQRRYIITLKDGVVISKTVDQESPHPMNFDSYEMQTTQNEDKLLS